jgi:hypothetical protein
LSETAAALNRKSGAIEVVGLGIARNGARDVASMAVRLEQGLGAISELKLNQENAPVH